MIVGLCVNKIKLSSSKINIYTGDYFNVPENCKHIALIGCTPHPTNYLKNKDNKFELLHNIKLNDFLDIEYLNDSFQRTFKICSDNKVDHLVIAYLPIYYIGLRQVFGNQFVRSCRVFLYRIIKEIESIIQNTSKSAGFAGNITLILPTDSELAKVPQNIADINERIKYLVKQFPRIENFNQLQTMTIINNKKSDEDDKID